MSAHTPGPWVAVISKMEGARIQQPGRSGTAVAWVGCDLTGPSDEDPHERMSDEAQANAALIAAAPEMLAELEHLVSVLEDEVRPSLLAAAVAVIAKARGEVAAAQPSATVCVIYAFSSRTCERGTKGCDIHHSFDPRNP